MIEIDIPGKKLNVLLSDEEMKEAAVSVETTQEGAEGLFEEICEAGSVGQHRCHV